jgi:hypothetical protein
VNEPDFMATVLTLVQSELGISGKRGLS